VSIGLHRDTRIFAMFAMCQQWDKQMKFITFAAVPYRPILPFAQTKLRDARLSLGLSQYCADVLDAGATDRNGVRFLIEFLFLVMV